MKKVLAMVMVMAMIMAFGVTAFAAGQGLTLDEAKQAALDYAGVKASEAAFTKAHRDWENGREVYEIEFYVGNTEYDMDVDVNTGRITDFSREYHGAYGQSDYYYGSRYEVYGDDWDDMYDYDHDFDDWFDWDD